ncbi:MAG: ribonuclease H-like domain-containing protein [bacterium]
MQNQKSKNLVFDIETIGEDFDKMDETTQEVLTRWIKKTSEDDKVFQYELDQVKNRTGFSPFTGEIVAVGVLDADGEGLSEESSGAAFKGAVYYQSSGEDAGEIEEDGFKFKVMSEKEMLEKFWQLALVCQEFISFNGRCFDIPFLMIRSAIHQIKPSKNLLSNRYLNLQPANAKHIDLMDQLSFYGAVSKKTNLHLACRSFGIKSPKAGGVTGDDVGKLFKEKKFLDIAKYNSGDLIATKELYEFWKNYLKV